MSYYIAPGGVFDQACTEWLKENAGAKLGKKKAASKTKYTCPECDAAAWGKPELDLVCGDCECRTEADQE